ncbi:peptidylprolyl isomerase [Rubrivirga litoralis]|uniref:Peptidyl-prolyl cis-trans isomerase n=1 Tax=Rubrivirga litoralis TaxID=3075598 RepID=A0ABU3BN00_9BACT|nr:peptidyl-prolyl cis-trans isomerase [Rubrivirga sp. F394]MDT0630671.1 peptidyl-prolyl cis-trans isomerase [Rubrivirga sp. F394]
MNSIRERAGGVLVGVLVVAFGGLWALQDSGAFDNVGRGRDGRTIGTVDGVAIDGELFNNAVQQQVQAYQAQGVPVSNGLQAQIENQVFDALVDNALVEREMDRLGIQVTDDEVYELIEGPNPDPLILQVLGDGQGGVDRAALQQVVEDPQYTEQLIAIEEQVRRNRRQAKLAALIGASARVSDAEVDAAFVRQNRRAGAEFVALRYADVPDSEVQVSDDDLRDYYRTHEADYERPATYAVEYVAFPKTPTAEDSARATDELRGLVADFRTAPDPVSFARRNSFGGEVEAQYVGAGDLPAALATAVFQNPTAGRVVGPVVAGGQAYVARITGVRPASEPSLRARHILLPAGQAERAREVKQQIESGQLSFEQAARQFSTDESNKDRGGELGWFGRGQLNPEFEQAAFAAPLGQVVGPVETPYGVHLIEVEDRADQEVELVRVSRPVEGDIDRVMGEAEDFQAFLDLEDQDFAEAARERGTAPTETQIQADQIGIPGLEVGRELNRFLRRASEGAVSDPIDAGDSFIVVRLVDERPEGVAPFDEVRDQIESAVLLDKKEAVQKEKLQQALAAGSLPGIAQAAGTDVERASDLSLADPVVPQFGREPRAVGAAFGLQPGQRSGVIGGDQAAFVVRTTSLVGGTDAELTPELREQIRQQLLQQKRQRVLQAWLEGLRDDAEVDDFRDDLL